MALELTTKFKGISTSPAARQARGQGGTDALKRCYGALNYIARADAMGLTAWEGVANEDGTPARNMKEARQALRQRFREEAAKGGKVGRRLATTGIVSLPNTWDAETTRDAMARLARELSPEGSEAAVLIVQHIDKTNNAHLHFLAVDGLENREAAARRARSGAQRIRRQNVQRFNERGAPRRWRARIAAVLNRAAAAHGQSGVEWRSFRERGLLRKAQAHEGPERRAREARTNPAKGFERLFGTIGFLGDDLETIARDALSAAASLDPIGQEGGSERARE